MIASYDGLVLPDAQENHRMLDAKKGTLYDNLNNLSRILKKHKLIDATLSYEQLLMDKFLL
ncbi:MAG: hypothetical protein SD837_03975 [Candidatus Electrothrix scaldis]|nr:MAG: hypothetical protein SD837_03975 [Candidatus Electrothrix sp. GW3-3]